ncbi:MAG: O-antigen ligase family protein [Candidatus Falkowbacteria bacterium]
MKINAQQIVSSGLYALAVLLPFNTKLILDFLVRPSLWEFDRLALFGTDLLIMLILGFALQSNRVNDNKRRLPFYWLAWALLIVVCSSLYFSLDKAFVLFAVTRLLLAIGLCWTLITAVYSRRRLILALIIGGALCALLGVGQFFAQSAPGNKWLGLALHDPIEPGTSVIFHIGKTGIGERWLRAYGTLDHPNMLGGYLALMLIAGCWLILHSKDNKQLLTAYLLLIIITAGLFVSFSRTGLLAAGAGLAVLLIINYKHYKKIIPLLIMMLAVWGMLSLNFGVLWLTRGDTANRLEKKSLDERTAFIQESLALIKKRPLIGYGFGNYPRAVQQYIQPGRQPWDYQPVHNTWLLVQAEIGVIGALCFTAIYILLVIFSIFALKFDRIYGSLNLALLAGLGVILTLDHWLWTLHFGILLFWLLAGLMIRNLEEEQVDKMIKIG